MWNDYNTTLNTDNTELGDKLNDGDMFWMYVLSCVTGFLYSTVHGGYWTTPDYGYYFA